MFVTRPRPAPASRRGRTDQAGADGSDTSESGTDDRPIHDPRPHRALLARIGALTDDQLEVESTRIAAAISAAQAELAAVLAEVERRGVHSQWDCTSIERFAGWKCQVAPSRAAALSSLGRAMHELPTLGAAVVSGALSADKAVIVSRVASPESEAALVDLALNATVDQTRRICSAWRRTAPQVGELLEPERDAAAEIALDGAAIGHVIVIHDDDGVELRARFDHVNGALVLTALDSITAQIRSDRRAAAPIDPTDERRRAADLERIRSADESAIGNVAGARRSTDVGDLSVGDASVDHTDTSAESCDRSGPALETPASTDEMARERLTTEQWRALGLLRMFEIAASDVPTTIRRSGFSSEVVVHVPIDTLLDPSDDDPPATEYSDTESWGIDSRGSGSTRSGPTGTGSTSSGPTSSGSTGTESTEGPPPSTERTPSQPAPHDHPPHDRQATALIIPTLEPRGIRLRRDQARLLVCDSGLHVVLEDAAADPLHLGRRTNSITPAQRRAVHARHQHCTWPGCTALIVQLHHRHHRVAGGNDDIENLVPLCSSHHSAVHRRSIVIGRAADGQLRFVRADGTHISADSPFARRDPSTGNTGNTGNTAVDQLPLHPGHTVTDLRDRQRALGIDVDAPIRRPQWLNDPFELAACIDAVIDRRAAAIRRTMPTGPPLERAG